MKRGFILWTAVLMLGCGLSAGAALWTGTVDLGGGWRWSGTFGYFIDVGGGWIYHGEHGWLYASGESTASVWFWSYDGGWLWTSAASYPSLYRLRDGTWVWYRRGSVNPRWFYVARSLRWENDRDFSESDFWDPWNVTATGVIESVTSGPVPITLVMTSVFHFTVGHLGGVCLLGNGGPMSTDTAVFSDASGCADSDMNLSIGVNTGSGSMSSSATGHVNVCVNAYADGSMTSTGLVTMGMNMNLGHGLNVDVDYWQDVRLNGQFVDRRTYYSQLLSTATQVYSGSLSMTNVINMRWGIVAGGRW